MARCLAAAVVLLAGACGPRAPSAPPTIRPTGVVVADFLTAKQALELALTRLPSASAIARITVSFPRSGGKAEFWSIDLVTQSGSAAVDRIQIQGKRVVAVTQEPLPLDGSARLIDPLTLTVDTSAAVEAVKGRGWFLQGDDVTMAPEVLGIADERAGGFNGKPYWHLIVTSPAPSRQLRGAAWVASESGEVIFECHLPEVPC